MQQWTAHCCEPEITIALISVQGETATATAEAEKDVAHPFDGKSMFLSAFRGGEPRGGKVVKGFFVLSPTVRSPSLNPENTDFSQLGKRVPGKWGCPETFPANRVEVLVVSRVHLCDPMDCNPSGSSVLRQECLSRLPFPSPRQ